MALCGWGQLVKKSKAQRMATCGASRMLLADGSEQIQLDVRCLNGGGCMLSLDHSALGRELHQMVSERLPSKKGTKPVLHHLESPLLLHQTLQEQEIAGRAATLSCTYVPTNLCAAWSCVQGYPRIRSRRGRDCTRRSDADRR